MFLRYGQGDLKNKAIITLSEATAVFERCSTFHKLELQKFFHRPSIQHVLLRMHKIGKYYPSAKWIASGKGRGMSIDRANAAWLLTVCPGEVKVDHVVSVHFGGGCC